MDYRYVVRILVAEDRRLCQEFVAKSHRSIPTSPVRRKLLRTVLSNERSWWALTMALAVLMGLLLVRLMQ
jgi:hypothetical protein